MLSEWRNSALCRTYWSSLPTSPVPTPFISCSASIFFLPHFLFLFVLWEANCQWPRFSSLTFQFSPPLLCSGDKKNLERWEETKQRTGDAVKREVERKSRNIAVGGEFRSPCRRNRIYGWIFLEKERERLEVIIGSFPIFYIFNSFALETFMQPIVTEP